MSTGDDAYALLEQLPDGVVAVGGDGVVEFVNGRAATLIGRASADLVGRAVTDALPLLDGAGQSWWELSDPWGGPAIRTGHRERMLLLPGQGHLLVTMQYIREEHLGPVRAARYLKKFHPWYVERLGAPKSVQDALQRADTLDEQRAVLLLSCAPAAPLQA